MLLSSVGSWYIHVNGLQYCLVVWSRVCLCGIVWSIVMWYGLEYVYVVLSRVLSCGMV